MSFYDSLFQCCLDHLIGSFMIVWCVHTMNAQWCFDDAFFPPFRFLIFFSYCLTFYAYFFSSSLLKPNFFFFLMCKPQLGQERVRLDLKLGSVRPDLHSFGWINLRGFGWAFQATHFSSLFLPSSSLLYFLVQALIRPLTNNLDWTFQRGLIGSF